MVQDYEKQKEENKKNGTKRRMTQGEWYTQHAVGYGLQIRKKQAATKNPLRTLVGRQQAKTMVQVERK